MSCDNFILEALDGNWCRLRRMGGRCNVYSTLCTHCTVECTECAAEKTSSWRCAGQPRPSQLQPTCGSLSVQWWRQRKLWAGRSAAQQRDGGQRWGKEETQGRIQPSRLETKHHPHLTSQKWVRGNNLGHGTSSPLHCGDCRFSVRHTDKDLVF